MMLPTHVTLRYGYDHEQQGTGWVRHNGFDVISTSASCVDVISTSASCVCCNIISMDAGSAAAVAPTAAAAETDC